MITMGGVMKKRLHFTLVFTLIIALTSCSNNKTVHIIDTQNIKPTESTVVVENIKSDIDYNENSMDDYTDFVNGARKDALNYPTYDPSYISENNGYPNDNKGVCTDVIWRAFKEAGYSLRTILNEDIKNDITYYTQIIDSPNPNIDFRRVKPLKHFFYKYALNLEVELNDPYQWQPGDIIVFNPNDYHIGILSDKRNNSGFPLVIHNMGQKNREEDFLTLKKENIAAHFRFESKNIEADVLKPWIDGEDKI